MTELALDIHCEGEGDFSLSLNCALPAQGITAIYGPSGSGKSTLLDCIAGLRAPQPGSVIQFKETCWLAANYRSAPWERNIGYVFQDARLFPHLNVRHNLLYAQQRQTSARGPSWEQIVQWLDLSELLELSPETLSAGQKQRVAIARALLSAPRLLLLDEPLANLDHAASQKCLSCLLHVAQEMQLPMLYVSHDIEEVSQLADHLILLEKGRLVDSGSLLDLCSRLDTRLSREEQAAAIVTARVSRHDHSFGLTELELEGQPLLVNQLSQAPGQLRRVRIPARDVSLCRERPVNSSILNILPVTIIEIEDSSAPRLLLRLALGSQHLLARITRKSAVAMHLQIGDRVYAQIKSAALLMEATGSP